jgi:hypothetical protein
MTCTCHFFKWLAVTDCQLLECHEENAFRKILENEPWNWSATFFGVIRNTSHKIDTNSTKLPAGQPGTLRNMMLARASSDATMALYKFSKSAMFDLSNWSVNINGLLDIFFRLFFCPIIVSETKIVRLSNDMHMSLLQMARRHKLSNCLNAMKRTLSEKYWKLSLETGQLRLYLSIRNPSHKITINTSYPLGNQERCATWC